MNGRDIFLLNQTGKDAPPMNAFIDDLGRPTPALGVGEESPAALQLMTDLCRHLIGRIEEIAKPG